MSFDQAFSFASKARPVIFPNMGFQRQLGEFEQLLQVKRQHAPKELTKKVNINSNNFRATQGNFHDLMNQTITQDRNPFNFESENDLGRL